jgi:hypothetical protein
LGDSACQTCRAHRPETKRPQILSIEDHENRLRKSKRLTPSFFSVTGYRFVWNEALVEVFNGLRNLEKKVWMAIGALSLIITVLGLVAFNINVD